MALGFARGANYLERQGLAEEILYCCSVVHGEGYLVMLKGASEIFWFALGLFLLGNNAPAHPQQSRHTGINCCVRAAAAPTAAGSQRVSSSSHR